MARGDIDDGIISCGQVAGLIEDVPSIKEVVDTIISGAKEICEKLKLSL
jgi:nitronate monooxygenase